MGANRRPRIVQRLYRWLLLAYPRHRRREDGDEMGEMFADICDYEETSKGIEGRARLAAATLRDLSVGALAERRSAADALHQDIRYGARRLRDHPTATLASVITLAMGIGAMSSVYTLGYAIALNPLPFPEVDRLVVLGDVTPRQGLNGEGWTHPAELRRWMDLESLDSLTALRPGFGTMTGGGDPVEVIGYRALPNFFEVIGVRPMLGRAFNLDAGGGLAAGDENAVVLGHAFWLRYFGGDPEVLGRSVRLYERPGVIVGIMPPGAEFPMGTDLLVPLVLRPAELDGYDRSLRPLGRLAPGTTIERLRAELAPLDAVAAEERPDTHADVRVAVESVVDNVTLGGVGFKFLMGVAACLLLLVCGNVANIQLAQAAARQREIATRKALGAPRARLVRQLLVEGMLLASLAAVAGTLLAAWSSRLLSVGLAHERWRFFFTGMDRVGVNGPVLAFTAAVTIGTVVMFGLVPALHGSAVDLGEMLRRSGTGARRGNRLRGFLVALEVVISVVLLAGAGLMARSVGTFARFDAGLDTEVLTVRLRLPPSVRDDEPRRRAFLHDALEAARGLPGVDAVALTNRRPVPGDARGTAVFVASSDGAPDALRAEVHVVGGDYFGTLGIPMLRGRGFDRRDGATTSGAVVVSEAFAEAAWSGAPALDRRVALSADGPWLPVVGVADNVARAFNDDRPAATVYLPTGPSDSRTGLLLLRARGDPGALAGALRERIWAIDEAVVVFAPITISDALDNEAWGVRWTARLVGGVAGVALLVCLAGIYALVAFAAAQRRREIGVRLALGASGTGVVRLLVLGSLRTAGIGLTIGLLIAYGAARALSGFADGGVASTDAPFAPQPVVFLGLAAIVLAMAALSSWLPARRAARVDPAVTLRAE